MTPKQTLIMWCLLGKHGEALQMEIKPRVEKKDREVLVSNGFVNKSESRPYKLTMEDRGWRWAGEHLGDELPPNYQVLGDWLTKIAQHLERSDQTLADFIGPAPQRASDAPAKQTSRRRKQAGPKRPKRPTAAQIRARIEEAYLAVTNGRKAENALLSKVRAQLADLDRATVDAGLLAILQGDEKARLGQISDPKALTSEEREAAFSPGGEPFHLLWIEL